ncbi:hypothetical protein ASF78_08205 [Cellulomonas sp. Leaf334]|nr:hypothetical protein ASF78_08205 [Cellulomonas sp. Leaf334]
MWPKIWADYDARTRNKHLDGHAGSCVLEDPECSDPALAALCTQTQPFVETRLGLDMRTAIPRLIDTNRGANTEQRCIILEGPETAGKTTSTMFEALTMWHTAMTDPAWPNPERARRPFAYTQIGRHWGENDIVRNVQDFLCFPYGNTDKVHARMTDLRDNAERMDFRAAFIDNAHNLRPDRSGRIPDGINTLLSGMPCSLIFIGLAPMSKSALLAGADDDAGSSARQIKRRARPHSSEFELSAARRRADWDRSTSALIQQFHLIRQDPVDGLRAQDLRDLLYERTSGLFGGTYDVLREAALDTIWEPRLAYEKAIRQRMEKLPTMPAASGSPMLSTRTSPRAT